MDASGKCLVTGRNKPTQKNRLANGPSGPVGDVIFGNATDNEESQWQEQGDELADDYSGKHEQPQCMASGRAKVEPIKA